MIKLFKRLFQLKRSSSERGDCTAAYDVIFDVNNTHPTVKEFLDYVISQKREWGRINIAPNAAYNNVWALITYKKPVDSLSYHWGEWGKNYNEFLSKYGNRKIKSATSDGGWSLMDYVLVLEDTVKYIEFGTVDIPTDFEKAIKEARLCIECMISDKMLTTEEYNSIMTTLDGAEARYYEHRNNI